MAIAEHACGLRRQKSRPVLDTFHGLHGQLTFVEGRCTQTAIAHQTGLSVPRISR
jgi:hypothetical protein